jgi:DNA replication protein DnaC
MTSENGEGLQRIAITFDQLKEKYQRLGKQKELTNDRYYEGQREARIAQIMTGPDGWDETSLRGQWIAARLRGQDLVQVSIQLSGLPLETRKTCRFNTFKTNKRYPALTMALEATKQWLSPGGPKLLTLAGPPGVGKTHLLLAAAWELVEKELQVLYLSQGALLRNGPRAADELVKEAEQIIWLFLDDLGAEGMAYDWVRAILDRLVDNRWLNHMPLMVGTNLKSEELPARLVDRLNDSMIGQVVPIEAPSHRMVARRNS